MDQKNENTDVCNVNHIIIIAVVVSKQKLRNDVACSHLFFLGGCHLGCMCFHFSFAMGKKYDLKFFFSKKIYLEIKTFIRKNHDELML